MAIDGLKIIDSDTAHDIYIAITEDWKDGKTAEQIKQKILRWQQSFCFNTFETEIYWTAFAYGLWKIGNLNEYVQQQALKIIANGADTTWQEFEPNGQKKRQKILDKLAEQLQNPNPKPINQPKIKPPKMPYFEEGDVVAVKFEEGYGAFFVVIINQMPRETKYHFAMTDLLQPNLPTLQDVLKSNILFREQMGFDSSCRVSHKNVTALMPHFQKIAKVELTMRKMGTYAPANTLERFESYTDKNSFRYTKGKKVLTATIIKKIILQKV